MSDKPGIKICDCGCKSYVMESGPLSYRIEINPTDNSATLYNSHSPFAMLVGKYSSLEEAQKQADIQMEQTLSMMKRALG